MRVFWKKQNLKAEDKLINIIFFGPPGAGKGTQAKKISNYFELPHLSTGDILRKKINEKDKLAEQLKDIMSSGALVSDDILNQIVSEKLLNECQNGFILDGYPRTLDQSKFIEDFFYKSEIKLNFIFNIILNFETLKKRILKRSAEEGRDDDNLDAIQKRYTTYIETTKLASDYYSDRYNEIFHNIEGDQEIDKITSKMIKIIENS